MTRLSDRPPLPFLRTLFREAIADDLAGEAARSAYFSFLSLFPAVLALFSLTGLFGGDEAFEAIMRWIRQALPGDAAAYLERFVAEITGSSRPGMLSLGLLLLLWSGSSIFTALIAGLNRVYDLEETRPWWRRRLLSLLALAISLILVNLGAVIALGGPSLVRLVGDSSVLEVLRWPASWLLFSALLWALFYLLPSRQRRSAAGATLIGAASGASVWLLGTLGFRWYVSEFSRFDATYGFVGGVMVLLLWLYLTSFSVLLGGEIAATLEQSARDDWEIGSAPGARASKD